jgi:uncharacterized protein (TIGR00251 family)
MTDKASLCVHLQPRAKENRIVGWHGDALKIRLTAPPVDQKANQALILLLAETFGVARGDVRILHGEKGRDKQVRIEGVSQGEVAAALARVCKGR